jgi:hypothetical protein
MNSRISFTLLTILLSFSVVFAAPDSVKNQIEKETKNKNVLDKELKVDVKPVKDRLSLPNSIINKQNSKSDSSTPSNKLDKSERKEFANQAPCLQTLNMMEKRITVMEENLKKRRALVEKIQTNLTSKIQTLKTSGLDTSNAENALNNYINQTNDILNQREGLIMVLADLTRFDCGGDPVNFKNNLKDFNQRFKNQNLEFNRINQEFRVKVLYEISNLIESIKITTTEPSSTENE